MYGDTISNMFKKVFFITALFWLNTNANDNRCRSLFSTTNPDYFTKYYFYVVNEIPKYSEKEWLHISSLGSIPFPCSIESGRWLNIVFHDNASPDDQINILNDKSLPLQPLNLGISYRHSENENELDLIRYLYRYRGLSISLYECSTTFMVAVSDIHWTTGNEKNVKKIATLLSDVLLESPLSLQYFIISKNEKITVMSTNPLLKTSQLQEPWNRIDCIMEQEKCI